jgi:hypothetical protein
MADHVDLRSSLQGVITLLEANQGSTAMIVATQIVQWRQMFGDEPSETLSYWAREPELEDDDYRKLLGEICMMYYNGLREVWDHMRNEAVRALSRLEDD